MSTIDVTNFGSTTAEFVTTTMGHYGAHGPAERPQFNGAALRERYADDPVALAMIDYIEELLAASAYAQWPAWSTPPATTWSWGTGTIPATWSPLISTTGTTWTALTTSSGPTAPLKAKRRKRR